MSERETLISGLREFADFLETHPNAPIYYAGQRTFDAFLYTREELAVAIKTVGGRFEKIPYGTSFAFRRKFGPLNYDLNIARREICERIVTGIKIVPSIHIPEHEEEIVEWRCTEPILGSPKTEASSEVSE